MGDSLASQADERSVAVAGLDVLLPEQVSVALEREEVLLLELSETTGIRRERVPTSNVEIAAVDPYAEGGIINHRAVRRGDVIFSLPEIRDGF